MPGRICQGCLRNLVWGKVRGYRSRGVLSLIPQYFRRRGRGRAGWHSQGGRGRLVGRLQIVDTLFQVIDVVNACLVILSAD